MTILCPGFVSLWHVRSQRTYVCGCSLLSLVFYLHRETMSIFRGSCCLEDREAVMADLVLSGVVSKQ